LSRDAYHDDLGAPRGPVVGRPEVLRTFPELAAAWDLADQAFPVRVTRSFWERALAAGAPLTRQVLPDARELEPFDGERVDPVGERRFNPLPWVVHKEPSRVLLLVTKRCHLYCRYCFRRTHDPADAEDPSPEAWDAAIRYAATSGAEEVILSGGDPLAVRDAVLFDAIDRLRPTIPVIRIHTRAPITRPDRVTPALVAGLVARAPVWTVVHCNHAAELSPDVDAALARFVDAGLPVLNQSVLLAGVNDDPEALAALSRALVRRRVFPYYLHHPDDVLGAGHFRVDRARGLEIYGALARRVSGVALPRYVLDAPDGSGKRDVLADARAPLG